MQEITQIFNNKNTFLLYVYLIDVCNYNCTYCYNLFPRSNLKIDSDALIAYIIKLHNVYKKDIDLNLIGGEPILHPQIFYICEQLNNLQFVHITCFSNFSLPVDTYLKLLSKNVHLNLSWHSQNKYFFSKLNNERIKAANSYITLLLMYEEHCNINVFNEYFKLKQFYTDVHIIKLTHYNYSKESNMAYEKYVAKKQSDNINNILCIVSKTKKYVSLYKIEHINLLHNSGLFNRWLCSSGIECQYIHADGKIYRCQSAFYENDHSIGNIYSNNIFLQHQIICKYKTCNCELEISKKKIFAT